MPPDRRADPAAAVAPIARAADRLRRVLGAVPPRWLLVDVAAQRLVLVREGGTARSYRVSTAAAGVDARENSGGTPPGAHRIARKIGAGSPLETIFRGREPAGLLPGPAARGEDQAASDGGGGDLILARILTLEGCEERINRGPGVDSLARYIYIHGTDDQERLGAAVSHGCIRMAPADIAELFEEVAEGDPVLVLPAPAPWYHFAGVGGSGMSALAQYHAGRGGRATGSDRAFDRGERERLRACLQAAGVVITPQDGSGLSGPEPDGGTCDALIVSTAVEQTVPDVREAHRLGVPLRHRSELLAEFVRERRAIAVAGTSGKSTVAALIFELLRGAGRDPSIITGGELVCLQRAGLAGNAWGGGGDLLVIEADESDGSLVAYEPWAGVLLNLHRDHQEPAAIAEQFGIFRRRTRGPFVAGEDENLDALAAGAVRFGLGERCGVRALDINLVADGARFKVEAPDFASGAQPFVMPVPGLHNVRNALAAIAACLTAGLALEEMVEPLWRFAGVARRFQSAGRTGGVEVIDDFAHNPAKIRAAVAAARARGERVLAVFQPHGFGPTRFLRDDLIEAFADALRPQDRLYLPEIYYAGGTAARDISAREIADAVARRGVPATFAPARADLLAPLAAEARPGDVILVMGARDPSLTDFCRDVLAVLKERPLPAGEA